MIGDIQHAHVTSADGCRIAYRDEGPESAPVLLLCTMAQSAMGVWDSLAAGLTDRYRVIRHDRRGDGDSDPGAPESHSFDQYARDAILLLQARGVERAAVMGMAFGARVAMRLVLDAPELVSSLLLFDVTGGPPAPEAERTSGRAFAAALRHAAGLAETPVEKEWFARRDPAGKGLASRALKDQPAWLPGIGRIAAPTLVACGEQDPNIGGARRVAAELSDARFEAMPMTGHGSILDRPDLVLRLTRDFLDAQQEKPA